MKIFFSPRLKLKCEIKKNIFHLFGTFEIEFSFKG